MQCLSNITSYFVFLKSQKKYVQIFRITYTYHLSFSKCQRRYFACISTHTVFVWHIGGGPELPSKCRSSVRCVLSRSAHMEWVWHIHLSAVYVLRAQYRSNWQFKRKSARTRWKTADCLTCWREPGIWERNEKLKPPQRDEDLLFSQEIISNMFLPTGDKKVKKKKKSSFADC